MKRISTLLLAVLAVLSLALPAYALTDEDWKKACSVTIIMEQGGEALPGGSVTLYRVGKVVQDDGDSSFALTGGFQGCGENLENLDSASLPKRLRKYAMQEGIDAVEIRNLGDDGKTTFSGLEAGLYLVVQYKAAKGYECCDPFLVSLPYYKDGKYHHDLTAGPKPALIREPEKQQPVQPRGRLPQTGQLNWPVPVLTAAGLALFTLGWGLRFGKRRDYEE